MWNCVILVCNNQRLGIFKDEATAEYVRDMFKQNPVLAGVQWNIDWAYIEDCPL